MVQVLEIIALVLFIAWSVGIIVILLRTYGLLRSIGKVKDSIQSGYDNIVAPVGQKFGGALKQDNIKGLARLTTAVALLLPWLKEAVGRRPSGRRPTA